MCAPEIQIDENDQEPFHVYVVNNTRVPMLEKNEENKKINPS